MTAVDSGNNSVLDVGEVLQSFKTSAVGRALLPMEASFSLPIPIKNESGSFLSVFVFRAQRMDEKLKFFSPQGWMLMRYPSGQLARYKDYRILLPFGDKTPSNDVPIGVFPHKAIKRLSPRQYLEKRKQYYECVRRVLADEAEKSDFFNLLGLLMEPSLSAYYWYISPPGLRKQMEGSDSDQK